MKLVTFSNRVAKEILRDPLNLAFGLGFPVVLLVLLHAIAKNVPGSMTLFEMQNLAPGIAVFSQSFLTLFSATVIAKDRGSALLERLYTAPLSPAHFILGYMLPILPIALAQTAVCYLCAAVLGLPLQIHVLSALLMIIPISLFYIALGLLCGSVFTDKQVGGICGALLTNLSAWLSGIWFDLELVGGAFLKIANLLPFVHAVKMERAALQGAFDAVTPHIGWVIGYTTVVLIAAVLAFLHQMKK